MSKLKMIVFLASALLFIACAGCEDLPNKSTHDTLKGEANIQGRSISITNHDTYKWTKIKVQINTDVQSNSYNILVNRILPGETITKDLGDFTDNNMSRFNPNITKLTDVDIDCNTPTGSGSWHASF